MLYWYVLFVMTGYEPKVASEIFRSLPSSAVHPFIPMYEARFKKAGVFIPEKRRLAPGYVFLQSPMRGSDFYLFIKPYIAHSEYALKLLRHGVGNQDHNFEMSEAEQMFMQTFLNDDYFVEMSEGFIKGTTVFITDGPLVGLEGSIKKINRHKMEAVVEATFMGSVRELIVGLEIVAKLP